jgi:hypothetical protein
MDEHQVTTAFAAQVLGLDGTTDEEPPAGSLLARLRAYETEARAAGESDETIAEKVAELIREDRS